VQPGIEIDVAAEVYAMPDIRRDLNIVFNDSPAEEVTIPVYYIR
jgi:hypothetical protein